MQQYPNRMYNHGHTPSYTHIQNPNPNFAPSKPLDSNQASVGLIAHYHPPGVESSVAHQQNLLAYSLPQAVNSATVSAPSTAYYQDPNWSANLASGVYGGVTISSNSSEVIPPSPNLAFLSNAAVQPRKSGPWKKVPKQKVPPAWCDVCKLECNSKDILAQHKLGRKHKKNVEKLLEKFKGTNTATAAPLVTSDKPIIGPEVNPNKSSSAGSKSARRKAAETEDLDTKRRKVLEGGAAQDAVRTCTFCNVVCNSDTVFKSHLAGQKHAFMVKKQASAAGVAVGT